MKGQESGLHSHWDAWDFIFSEAPRPGLEATQLTRGRITGSKADRSYCDHLVTNYNEYSYLFIADCGYKALCCMKHRDCSAFDFISPWCNSPWQTRDSSLSRFHDHTQTHHT